MSFNVRRYTEDDIPKLVEYIGDFLKESPNYRGLSYDPVKMGRFLSNNTPNQLFCCNLAVDNDGEILAGICAKAELFVFSNDVQIADLILYHRPIHRSVRCIDALIQSYAEWARLRHPDRVLIGATTGIPGESFGKLVNRHGFREIGRVYALDL